MKIQCIIADDEPLARKGIENFVRDIPFLELVGTCSNAMEVMDVLTHKKVDLLFLDIQMPKMSGISLLKNMPQLPLTIITTAYPNYAVESYEFGVVDYLIKPIPFDRFVKAVNKAKDYFELAQNKGSEKAAQADFCFIKCEKSYEKLFFNDILYIEAMLNYVIIHTESKKYISYLTLKGVEDQLPSTQFMKINKSFLINVHKISRIEGNEVVIDKTHLQIGRSFKDEVMDVLLNGKLLKRQ